MTDYAGGFVWYELITKDLDAAEAFYGKVAGWRLQDAGMPGFRYTIAHAGEAPLGGLCAPPPEMCGDAPPRWVGHIGTDDVDATTERVRAAGGSVTREPSDIPNVGRFSVVADPQGAPFMLFQPGGEPPPKAAPGTPGTIGWHELHAKDWQAVYPFYAELFGWTQSTPVDMGPMGTYQLIARAGADFGGMFTDGMSPGVPYWLFYVAVDDIDAGHARILDAGGSILQGPHQVPGGMYIVIAADPQGALFALVGPKTTAAS